MPVPAPVTTAFLAGKVMRVAPWLANVAAPRQARERRDRDGKWRTSEISTQVNRDSRASQACRPECGRQQLRQSEPALMGLVVGAANDHRIRTELRQHLATGAAGH